MYVPGTTIFFSFIKRKAEGSIKTWHIPNISQHSLSSYTKPHGPRNATHDANTGKRPEYEGCEGGWITPSTIGWRISHPYRN